MTQLKEQLRFRKRLLRKIALRTGAGSGEIGAALLETETRRYLHSHQVQCAALYDIWCNDFGVNEALARWKSAQRQPLVPFDYRRFRALPVEWHNKPRRTSGYRKICRFQPLEKMWHVLAADLIGAMHDPRPHIGDWRRRGRDQQMGRLLALIGSPWQAVVAADIRCAFARVNVDAVYDLLSLPEPLVRRAIDYRSHKFVRRERSVLAIPFDKVLQHDLEVAPTGLMEGSPVSNAIFSVLMDDLPDHLGKEIEVFVYCDNIILLAPSMLHAQRAENALVRYLTGHRAGPFEVRSEVHPITRPFEHLGYSIRLVDGVITVGLSTSNWRRFGQKLDDERVPLKEAIEWLSFSFPHVSEPDLVSLLLTVLDEAAHRDLKAEAARR